MARSLRLLALLPLAACWAGGVPTVAPDRAGQPQARPTAPGAREAARPQPSTSGGTRAVPRGGVSSVGGGTGGSADPDGLTAAAAAKGATEIEALRELSLMVPVEGIAPGQVPDTYWSKRDGGRLHRAADIMAPKGTPVVAPVEGTVLKVGRNQTGGIVVYTTDSERRFVFYHAHLDRIADGLADNATLRQGDVIGYVGTTGNAPPGAPHLHFQVMRMPADGRYWEGMPVDVRPFLLKSGKAR
jgi:murein DD-endopeptidase MepM/ murein hydrolase activator NlpD